MAGEAGEGQGGDMSCDCYKIGGPWIAEDPDCPEHGIAAQRERKEHGAREAALEDQISCAACSGAAKTPDFPASA
jgi:hypothetical protein